MLAVSDDRRERDSCDSSSGVPSSSNHDCETLFASVAGRGIFALMSPVTGRWDGSRGSSLRTLTAGALGVESALGFSAGSAATIGTPTFGVPVRLRPESSSIGAVGAALGEAEAAGAAAACPLAAEACEAAVGAADAGAPPVGAAPAVDAAAAAATGAGLAAGREGAGTAATGAVDGRTGGAG